MKLAMPRQATIEALREYLQKMDELISDVEFDDDADRDEAIREHAEKLPFRYDHVLTTLDTLLSNCVDKDADTVEFAPWIDRSLKLLKEMDEYLDGHDDNYIGHRSKLHQEMKAVLALPQFDNRDIPEREVKP